MKDIKRKEEPKYVNIPVPPETYAKVKLLAESNGFGARGMGAQIAHWVGRDLNIPECDHEKIAVEVEYFPASTDLVKRPKQKAFYCETCNRVYARIPEADAKKNGKKAVVG